MWPRVRLTQLTPPFVSEEPRDLGRASPEPPPPRLPHEHRSGGYHTGAREGEGNARKAGSTAPAPPRGRPHRGRPSLPPRAEGHAGAWGARKPPEEASSQPPARGSPGGLQEAATQPSLEEQVKRRPGKKKKKRKANSFEKYRRARPSAGAGSGERDGVPPLASLGLARGRQTGPGKRQRVRAHFGPRGPHASCHKHATPSLQRGGCHRQYGLDGLGRACWARTELRC